MSVLSLVSLTFITLIAFAANSVFCRLALDEQNMDPMSFTGLRIASAALVLGLIMLLKSPNSFRSLCCWVFLCLRDATNRYWRLDIICRGAIYHVVCGQVIGQPHECYGQRWRSNIITRVCVFRYARVIVTQLGRVSCYGISWYSMGYV